ncbi:lipid A deacylase LpxR family protein, partial [Lactococcus petauri]|uniref:lipid A deacylase LpxR family protein n=1 Tax=Lactococcus petauri TaxID=1940789 RepID=UPI0021F1D7DC
ANGRVVGRDVTLNGTLWRSSPSVDPRHLVGELELGAAAFWRGIRLSFTHVWRSKEFVAQTAPFRFGSISVSVAF